MSFKSKYPMELRSASYLFNSNYKTRAKKRGLEFELTFEQFLKITAQKCHYCGEPPAQKHIVNRKWQTAFIYNGIDRINNSMGYTNLNCVPCCKICNTMKGTLDYDTFKKQVKKISSYE